MEINLVKKLKTELETIESLSQLSSLERSYLGNKGSVKQMLKEIGKFPPEQRKARAITIQKIAKEVQDLLALKKKTLTASQSEDILKNQAETLDLQPPKIGHLHPITQTIRELNKFFTEMGYSIMEDLELETDEFCFQRLNVPLDHPARAMQDTLYIKEPNYLLRTHTSSIEARVLDKYSPPLKVVSPGKVYRNEKVNKSNHFVFHHYQGLVVLPKVSLKDLFGTFTALFKQMYGPKVVLRYRNKYYPEVEPGAGVDMQCFNCHGKGCRLCKGVGWIEMGGTGIIHPDVLEKAGIDSKKWRGFAFGLGLDRWVMAKYKINDIRTLLGGNLGYKPFENENTL